MEHLLFGDLQQRLAPALDGRKLVRCQPLVLGLSERERREQVHEHHEVLELGGFAQRVDKRLAVLQAPGVCVVRPPPDLQDGGQRAVRARHGTRAGG